MDLSNYYQIYISWVEKHFGTFQIIDAILFTLFSLSVLYLLIFALSAKMVKRAKYPRTNVQADFLVFISVYGDNRLIFNSIDSILQQNYDIDKISIIVITNNCSDGFIEEIKKTGAIVAPKCDEWREDLFSGDYLAALSYCKRNKIKVDVVSIIHCGDKLEVDSIAQINDAYYCGCDAIQIRRYFEDRTSIIARLESVGEEINNTIFREGHTALGLSSAVMSSGLTLEFDTFRMVVEAIGHPYPEKPIEKSLLKRNIYIEYLNYVYMSRLKSVDNSTYYKDKRINNSSYRSNLIRTIFTLPKYLYRRKFDYCNKILQWAIPSRIVLTVLMTLLMILSFIANWVLGIKWLILIFIIITVYFISIPNYLVNRRLLNAIILAPFYLVITTIKMIFFRR